MNAVRSRSADSYDERLDLTCFKARVTYDLKRLKNRLPELIFATSWRVHFQPGTHENIYIHCTLDIKLYISSISIIQKS